MNLIHRERRLRRTETLRKMTKETHLSVDDLIYPLFVVEGENIKKEIPSLKGQYYHSIDKLDDEMENIAKLKIPSVLLFGLPEYKDEKASCAYNFNGIVQKAVRKIKSKYPDIVIITDVCLCQYMSHGHCGVLSNGEILNDESVELIAKTALSHAEAGADIVAPSDMMDGRIGAIRKLLDEEGYINTSIMSYSIKYASAYYGPFRDVADSAPKSGNRKSYQMDPANSDEAMREAMLDIEEGADILMVKPAMSYQDIIYRLKHTVNYPIAAYNVSGEYAMIQSAAEQGLIDKKNVVLESLIGLKRAGANLIITYFAKDVAKWLKEES